MTTYTLIHADDFILVLAPDGSDVRSLLEATFRDLAAGHDMTVEQIRSDFADAETETGLILTDDKPDNEDLIVSDDGVCDETGREWAYAVRQS